VHLTFVSMRGPVEDVLEGQRAATHEKVMEGRGERQGSRNFYR